ncbi:MAG: hypothetical protein KGH79_00725 [Patescibacteria group bacterium]|nr:hypothetical protein [Patescibacteria group bacterium]
MIEFVCQPSFFCDISFGRIHASFQKHEAIAVEIRQLLADLLLLALGRIELAHTLCLQQRDVGIRPRINLYKFLLGKREFGNQFFSLLCEVVEVEALERVGALARTTSAVVQNPFLHIRSVDATTNGTESESS